MSWQSNAIIQRLRALARSLGLTRLISKLRSGGYEQGFDRSMMALVRPGDCVWDVGANVGFYTTKFAKLVGESGFVVAFEPSPANQQALRQNTASLANVDIRPYGLGQTDCVASFLEGNDGIGATSRVWLAATAPDVGQVSKVSIRRGDGLIEEPGWMPPNVIKVDTEGYELDVLTGLREVLGHQNLRAVCIEVHFRLLEFNRVVNGPSQIELLLRNKGFAVRWTDASHIVGSRN